MSARVRPIRSAAPVAPDDDPDAAELLAAQMADADAERDASLGGTAPAKPKWRIWTSAEIYAPLPPIEWLVRDVFPVGSLALVVAYGSSLKSWAFVAEFQSALATGRPFLGRFAVRQCKTLGVDFENGAYEYRRRLQRIARAHGETRIAGTDFVTMPGMSLSDPEFLPTLEAAAVDYAAVVIDTYAAGNSGTDENDARFAAPLNSLKAYAERTGKLVVALHHTRKQKEGEDERETTRGTGAIFAALDVELKITRRKDGAFLCRQTKARNSRGVEPFIVRIEDVGADGTRVFAVDVEAVDQAEVHEGASSFEKKKAAVVLLLGASRDVKNASEVHRRLKGRKADVFAAVAELVERKLVVEHEGFLRLASEVCP